jgi:hydrogenase maturation factor
MFRKISKKEKFSYEATEAYWLGGDILKKAKLSDYKLLLKYFSKQGVPDWLVEDLKKQVPNKFVPLHLFQVLHVGVGRASGSVPYNLETINNCMVRWGEVIEICDSDLRLKICLLEKRRQGYRLSKVEENISFRRDFLPGVRVGDVVAVHWGQAVKKLTKKEMASLEYWTTQVLESVGQSGT